MEVSGQPHNTAALPQKKNFRYRLNRRVGGLKSQSRGFEDPNFSVVQSVACRVSGDVLNGHHEKVKTYLAQSSLYVYRLRKPDIYQFSKSNTFLYFYFCLILHVLA